jgi:hypothetical protein
MNQIEFLTTPMLLAAWVSLFWNNLHLLSDAFSRNEETQAASSMGFQVILLYFLNDLARFGAPVPSPGNPGEG